MKSKIMIFIVAVALLISSLIYPAKAARSGMEVLELPIMMYHEVRPKNFGKDAISPSEFEDDLKYLKEHGYNTVTMADVIDYVHFCVPLPPKPIILSFDDGCLSTYKNVFPLLEKYDVNIVLSIIAKAAQDFSERPSNAEYAHMTWDQMSKMKYSGHAEIQNHTYDLHKYGKGRIGCGQRPGETVEQYESVLREDTARSQQMIFENTGSVPDTFTYPYGKYSDNTVSVLKKLGFSATLSCRYGINLLATGDTECLYSMKRICSAHGRSISKLLEEADKTIKR